MCDTVLWHCRLEDGTSMCVVVFGAAFPGVGSDGSVSRFLLGGGGVKNGGLEWGVSAVSDVEVYV